MGTIQIIKKTLIIIPKVPFNIDHLKYKVHTPPPPEKKLVQVEFFFNVWRFSHIL